MSHKSVSVYLNRELQKYITPESKNYLLCTWYRYMFQYIPFKTGLMASLMDMPENKKDIKVSPDEALQNALAKIQSEPENVIRFKAPYAHRQYCGENFNFTKELHPLSTAGWAQVAADLHGEQIVKEFAGYVKSKE